MSLVVDKNKVINTPIEKIVELLRQQLFLLHLDRLNTIEHKNSGLRFTCPFHSNGHERTPSCEILLEDKGSTPAGTVHCFSCGYKARLVKFIADCLNTSYRQATEWLLSISNYELLEATRDIPDLDIDKHDSKCVVKNLVPIDELRQYDYIHPYMYQRKLTDDIIKKFEVGYDSKLDALTFPVYVNGDCLFVAKRRVKFKRFDMPTMAQKPLYGLDYVTSNEVILCESVIDALYLWSIGYQAIAMFGTGSDYQLDLLTKIKPRTIIIATDGDIAGNKAAIRIAKKLTNKIVMRLAVPKDKDVNDLTKEEIDYLYNNQKIMY